MTCTCLPDTIKERNGHTASCNREQRRAERERLKPKKVKKPIAKNSDKMAIALQLYAKKKKAWIKGKTCAVMPGVPAVDIHHKKGRATIELLLDERYWLPVSRGGHVFIEENPLWAKEKGFSLSRLSKETP